MSVDAKQHAVSVVTQCLASQWLVRGQSRDARCKERAVPQSVYCWAHRTAAMLRVRGVSK